MAKAPDMIITFPHKDGEGVTFQNLYWSSERPKAQGFYFAVSKEFPGTVDLVSVDDPNSDKYGVSMSGCDEGFSFSYFTKWLGPLTEPEAPK